MINEITSIYTSVDTILTTISVVGSAFIELILHKIDFDGINLVRINFEAKLFMFNSLSKSDYDKK